MTTIDGPNFSNHRTLAFVCCPMGCCIAYAPVSFWPLDPSITTQPSLPSWYEHNTTWC